MKLFRKQEGFTLVELMVVVLIIGILVAIAIPVFNTAKRNAQRKSCFANQRTIDGAINSYQAEYGTYAADVPALVTAQYLKRTPLDPATNAAYTLVNTLDEVNACPNAGGADDHGSYHQ
jgi:prepilin-type N-terminal cleavage/methylation domain-containing protein